MEKYQDWEIRIALVVTVRNIKIEVIGPDIVGDFPQPGGAHRFKGKRARRSAGQKIFTGEFADPGGPRIPLPWLSFRMVRF